MKTIRFESQEHENFFYSMLKRTGNTDSYHQAFFYCVGISDTTRRNVERIFDFKQGHIRPEGLHEGWQTGGSIRPDQGLPSIFGMDIRRIGMSGCPLRMRYLTAGTLPTSLRRSG